MRVLTAEAQILSVRDLQETDRIVSLLTAEHGRVRGVARGSKRKFSRFAGPLDPLAKVRATWVEKSSELVRFSDLDLLRPAAELQRELDLILYAAYIADQAETFAQERDAAPQLYRLLDRVVACLLAGIEPEAAVRYFELWVLRLTGILPEPQACAVCGGGFKDGASVSTDGLRCLDCGDGEFRIGRETVGFIALSRRQSPEELAAMEWPAQVLEEVEGVCATIRRQFLNWELRSYSVLKQLLAESP